MLVLPDIHLGHQARSALRCALRVYHHYKPETVLILGDMLDAHSFSSYPATPGETRAHYLRDEIEPAKVLLEELSTYGNEIIYLEGNHEERVRRWLLAQTDVAELILPEVLLARDNLTWVPYKSYHVQGSWVFAHGTTTCKDAARKHLDHFPGYSVCFGHTHRAQHVVRRCPVTNKTRHGICPGTLSELQPIWCHGPTTWSHGVVLIRGETPYLIPITEEGAILPCGTQISPSPGPLV